MFLLKKPHLKKNTFSSVFLPALSQKGIFAARTPSHKGTMNLWPIYHDGLPDFIRDMAATAPMQRLKQIGMNCGCEYTSFERFAGLEPYSRFDHSIGCALIVWYFTKDRRQSTAALLHDIATPVFAHVIDFLNGDHERQEYTELATGQKIEESDELRNVLVRYGLTVDDVADYHRYPVADNDTPRLSSDRLEYSLGNIVNYRIAPKEEATLWYSRLKVGKNEVGSDELMFTDASAALAFAQAALKASRIYVADEDRFAMQMLAELLNRHINRKVLSVEDLYTTEPEVIGLLNRDAEASADWRRFCAYRRMVPAGSRPQARIIPAKKRYVNPYIENKGRLSEVSATFAQALDSFLALSFEKAVCGE